MATALPLVRYPGALQGSMLGYMCMPRTAGVNKLWDWTESELQTLRGWDGSMQPEGGRVQCSTDVFHGTSRSCPKMHISAVECTNYVQEGFNLMTE